MHRLIPLPDKAFDELVSPWLKAAAKGESASIINISQRSQLYQINQLLTEKELMEKYLGNIENYNLVVVNLMSISLETAEELEGYLTDKLKKNKRNVVFLLD